MKQMELDMKLSSVIKKVEDSRLIPICEDIAIELGKVKKQQVHSAHTDIDRSFEYKDIKILHELHGWNNRNITVNYQGKKVFHVYTVPRPKDTMLDYDNITLEFKEKTYRVMTFLSGEWERKLQDIYKQMQEDVSTNKIKDLESRFGKIFED